MTTRLTLVCHAATAATQAAKFPADEDLAPSGRQSLSAISHSLHHADRSWSSPASGAMQTAEGLQLRVIAEARLRECDYGRWAGFSLADLQTREPDALAEWLRDPEAAPHGGESIVVLIARVAAWLDAINPLPGKLVAITHASVIRAALVHALGAAPRSFWRIDIAPLTAVMLSGHGSRWNLSGISSLVDGESPL